MNSAFGFPLKLPLRGKQPKITIITTSSQWVPTVGCRYFVVEIMGASGGGVYNRGNNSGGGIGGYGLKIFSPPFLSSYTVTVGAAGTRTPTASTAGGTSSFTSSFTVNGGGGATADCCSDHPGAAAAAGTGGDINMPGLVNGFGTLVKVYPFNAFADYGWSLSTGSTTQGAGETQGAVMVTEFF